MSKTIFFHVYSFLAFPPETYSSRLSDLLVTTILLILAHGSSSHHFFLFSYPFIPTPRQWQWSAHALFWDWSIGSEGWCSWAKVTESASWAAVIILPYWGSHTGCEGRGGRKRKERSVGREKEVRKNLGSMLWPLKILICCPFQTIVREKLNSMVVVVGTLVL